jgi:hypothetical protein
MKKRNKSYILFLYGIWDDDEKFIRDIRDILLLVVDSGYLKFVHGPSSAILSFKSMESFEDISEYLVDALPKYVTNYIFIPKPRKISHRFPDDMDKHLFDLDTNTNDLVDKQKKKDVEIDLIYPNLEESLDIPTEGIEQFMGKFDKMFEEFIEDVRDITTKGKNFNLDDILDKITENGVSSLTKDELEFLDNHNKNK